MILRLALKTSIHPHHQCQKLGQPYPQPQVGRKGSHVVACGSYFFGCSSLMRIVSQVGGAHIWEFASRLGPFYC